MKRIPPKAMRIYDPARMKIAIAALPPVIVALACGCNKSSQSPAAAIPFEYTNIVHQSGVANRSAQPETMITFTNNAWFSHRDDRISMGVGPTNYEVSIFFNPSDDTLRRVIQTTTIGTNHFTVIDTDGDGVPDLRNNVNTRDSEILLRGEWRATRTQSTNREVFVNSNWIPVRFENGRWQLHSTETHVTR
jgi:hypothetical protein